MRLSAVHCVVLLAVVAMVSVAVPLVAPAIVTGLVVPKLNAGGTTALAGLLVITAVSVTGPVNPPLGVTMMVEVFPVLAPAVTVTPVPLMAKAGGGAAAAVVNELMAPLAAPTLF